MSGEHQHQDIDKAAADLTALTERVVALEQPTLPPPPPPPPPPPLPHSDVVNGPAANDIVLWLHLDAIAKLTDAQLIDLRDNWGVTTFACGTGHLFGTGSFQRRTADTAATFTAADGRSGTQWAHCREVKYGNAGVGIVGNGNIVSRVHALGLRIYVGFKLVNYYNHVTPLHPWFDDAKWSQFLAPNTNGVGGTGGFAEFVCWAKAWGFDGLTVDDEMIGVVNPEPTWKWTHTGNKGVVATRAKVRQRGAEIGAVLAANWPDVNIIEYQTTGHGGFPDDWDDDFAQAISGVKESLTERDLWDGMLGHSGFTGHLHILSAIFYRNVGDGATWFGAEQYNVVSLLARLSRTWDWNRTHRKVSVSPFHWPGRAANQQGGEDLPMSLTTMQKAFAASRLASMKYIGFYTQTIANDKLYFTDAMKNVFRAAKIAGTVDTKAPTLTATRSGNTISGVAQHSLGIAYIEWEETTSTAIGAFPHRFVPGTGKHTSATGFADATYPFEGTVPAGPCRVTAVSIKGQTHSITV